MVMNRYQLLQRVSAMPVTCASCWNAFQLKTRLGTRNLKALNVKITNGEANRTLDKLNLKSVGGGSYGDVFRALDMKYGVHVMIKFLRKDQLTLARIRELSHECGITEELQRHRVDDVVGASRIVKCYFNAAETDHHMIIMEDGGQTIYEYLRSVMARNAPSAKEWVSLKSQVTKEILKQVLQGVQYMSHYKIWHRDLKPSNIAVQDSSSGSPVVKLIDFGFAEQQPVPDALKARNRMFVANFANYMYAPPELRRYHQEKTYAKRANRPFHSPTWIQWVARKLLVSVAAFDLWSVGVTFLQLVCGRGVSQDTDFQRTRDVILPALFPGLQPPDSGNYSAHIHSVLTRKGCWKTHTDDEDTLELLAALLTIDSAQRAFPEL
eukprot:TRINITY_DN3732_c0_g1_i1.p1 TRINITY_DN3732_c0_g1~~TRINITY_DN3732_c0_g1_i1.p1  ORF type:complete len:439 (-),score=36.21 TRINITY_DN3732_c0_g1_i1:62-1201(-)